jgi:flagellar motor switch protein FliG
VSAVISAGSLRAQTFDADKPIAEIETSMEENLTWNLKNALGLYYPETKFVIRANVELRKIVPKTPLPALPDALLNKELKNLPGLPYVPEDLPERRSRTEEALTLYQQVRKNNYDVRRIRVNVLLDRTLSEDDRAFIQRYVSVVADINRGRGDQVRIESLNFPSPADFPSEFEELEKSEPVLPVPTAATEKTAMSWLPWVVAGLVGLLLVAAMFFGFRALLKRLPRNDGQTLRPEGALALQNTKEPEVIHWSDVTKKANDETLQHLKSQTIDTIVGTPAAAAKVFQNWIDQRDQTAAREVAIVLSAVSKPLIDLLAPYLGAETVAKIQAPLDKIHHEELQEKAAPLLKKFDEDVRRLALETRESAEEEDALAFLSQMTDDQLQHLLKPLKQGVQAIVLAQLRPNRAAVVLNKFEPEERKAVLAAMGDIERIPVDVYQNLARQLAARAKEIDKMRYVRANGVDALVKVLDYFEEDAQNETIGYLQTQNMNLANKVTQRFMTFNQLVDLPSERIRELALESDRELFAKSLVKVSQKDVNKIIEALPPKLGELVEASLEANHDLSEQEVSQARRSLMRTIRDKKASTVS